MSFCYLNKHLPPCDCDARSIANDDALVPTQNHLYAPLLSPATTSVYSPLIHSVPSQLVRPPSWRLLRQRSNRICIAQSGEDNRVVMERSLLDSFGATEVAGLYISVPVLTILWLFGWRPVVPFLSIARTITWFLPLSVHQLLFNYNHIRLKIY